MGLCAPSAEALNWVHLKRNRSEIWIAALLDGGENGVHAMVMTLRWRAGSTEPA